MAPDAPHPTVDHDGRTFLALGLSSHVIYPLPVDGETLDVYDRHHYLMKYVVGSNYFYEADIKHALAPTLNRRRRAIDLGCGTGVWVREMAAEFPHADFTGIDIVDCWDRLEDEPDNIEFVIDDINGRTQFGDNTFDVVHVRQMRLAVVDFSAFLAEVARILRPRGLLLFGEWDRTSVVDHLQVDPSTYAPAITELNGMFSEILNRNGPRVLAKDVVPLIRDSGRFLDERYVLFPFLYGDSQFTEADAAVGAAMREHIMAHVDSMRHLLTTVRTEEELDELMVDVLEEMRTKPGIMCFYYLGIARKAGDDLDNDRTQ